MNESKILNYLVHMEYSLVKEYDHYGIYNRVIQRRPKSDVKYDTELSEYFEV